MMSDVDSRNCRLLPLLYLLLLVKATFIISFGDGSSVSSDTRPTLGMNARILAPGRASWEEVCT